MNKIHVLIADDFKLIREIWAIMLNNDPRFFVVGTSGIGEEFTLNIGRHQPDIILLSVDSLSFTGVNNLSQVFTEYPNAKVIVVSSSIHSPSVEKIIQLGAKGYVSKISSKDEIINAILEVSRGGVYICNEIEHDDSSGRIIFGKSQQAPDINCITSREREVINWVKQGSQSKEIAARLQISTRTVEVHRRNILKKLKFKNTALLVNFINTGGLQ